MKNQTQMTTANIPTSIALARVSLAFLVMISIGSTGCDTSSEEVPASIALITPEDADTIEVVEFAPEGALIARIDGEKDGMVEFLDLSEITGVPEIVVVAIGQEGAVMTQFVDEGASPLEVFLAFAPATDTPPVALIEDHAHLAAEGIVPASPRELQLWRETTTGLHCLGEGEPGDVYNWWVDWSSGFGDTKQVGDTGAHGTLPNGTKITVSNTRKRALEACATRHDSSLHNVKYQVLTGGVWWQLGSYTAPNSGREGWVVATRSISSPGGTQTSRFVLSTENNEKLYWFFWGGAYSF